MASYIVLVTQHLLRHRGRGLAQLHRRGRSSRRAVVGHALAGIGRWKPRLDGILPGLAISLAVFGLNLLGDSIRDLTDPRLRGGLG
jgi:hypothetical protein